MYKSTNSVYQQIGFHHFNQSCGLQLDDESDWIVTNIFGSFNLALEEAELNFRNLRMLRKNRAPVPTQTPIMGLFSRHYITFTTYK